MTSRAAIERRCGPARLAPSLVVLALAGGCSDAQSKRTSALVLTLDTTRADALGAFGGNPGTTPNLDALAAQSVVYAEARTVAPLTLPAHSSVFTGLYPPRHTVRDNQPLPLPRSAETLAERARAAGYQTAAFVSSIAVGGVFGLGQGFDVYGQPHRVQRPGSYVGERRAGETVLDARAWLAARDPSRPFLLWVHLFDPHAPYDPPPAFAGGQPYLGEVKCMDFAVGQLVADLKELGLWDETFVVVVGDHGEGLGDNDESTHGLYCYPATIRVPFLVRDPGGEAARRGEHSLEIVSVVDVYPTLVEALGLGAPGDVDGLSLFRRRVPEERGVYFESYSGYIDFGWSQLVGWADRAGAYLHGPKPLFFPAGTSTTFPGQSVGVAEPRFDAYRRAIAAMAARPALEPARDERVDEATLQDLRRLGYAAAGDGSEGLPHPLEDTGRPSPHDKKDVEHRIERGVELLNGGALDEAIGVFGEVARAEPDNAIALEFFSGALVIAQRYEEALEPLNRLLARGGVKATTYCNLATALWSTGRPEMVERHLRDALQVDPGHVQSMILLATLLAARGEEAEAQRYRELARAAQGRGVGD